jgi:hypothetical protein
MYPMQPPLKKLRRLTKPQQICDDVSCKYIIYITSSQMHHEPLDVLEGGLLISDNEEECASSYLCISCM